MIRIDSDTDIGMNRNSSDWLGIKFQSDTFTRELKINKIEFSDILFMMQPVIFDCIVKSSLLKSIQFIIH